jgi:Zn-dependent metalloprotease
MKALNLTLLVSFVTLSLQAHSAAEMSSQEISCRAKAKEVAAETYRGCVSEYKNAEVDRLRKNYQKKLKALKENYEREIDTLSGEKSSPKTKKTLSAKRSETVEVKESTSAPALSDESTMDLPEPVPVEN